MDYIRGRRPAAELRIADIWTPERPEDRHLTRVILDVDHGPAGEIIQYCYGSAPDWGFSGCSGVTFRQWISKMRAIHSVDVEWLEELKGIAA
jgi:hypothetical protein